MASESQTLGTQAVERHRGPSPGAVAVVFTMLFLSSLVPVTLIVSETHFPTPLQSSEEMVAYFQAESFKVRCWAFLQFASSVPLGIYVATMVRRLRFHRTEAAGVTIALFGGLAAATFVAISAPAQATSVRFGSHRTSDARTGLSVRGACASNTTH